MIIKPINIIKALAISVALIPGFQTAAAESAPTSVREASVDTLTSVHVYFRLGSDVLELDYQDNAKHINEFLDKLDANFADSTSTLHRVGLIGAVSPEGTQEYNSELAYNRARVLKDYIKKRFNHPELELVTVNSMGIDWRALREAIEADYSMPDRQAVLNLLKGRNIMAVAPSTDIINSLRRMAGGAVWDYLSEKYFPKMRNARMAILIENVPETAVEPQPEFAEVQPTVEKQVEVEEKVEEIFSLDEPETHSGWRLAFKNNLLYDAAAVPNLSIEVMKDNISVGADWVYAWWSKSAKNRFYRIYGGDVFVRYWLNNKQGKNGYSGHHLGLYGQVFTYDFEFGGKGLMGGSPNMSLSHDPTYGGGFEYGYAKTIGRHFSFDFTIGLGYVQGLQRKYYPGPHMWDQATKKTMRWYGPTKAEVSIVYTFGL